MIIIKHYPKISNDRKKRMKQYILISIIVLIFITGCGVSKQQILYDQTIMKLRNEKIEPTVFPFQISITLESITDQEFVYEVIIDEPTEPLHQVSAVVIHDQMTQDIFPNIGFFDETINLWNHKTPTQMKGLLLLGYLSKETTDKEICFKIWVSYQNEQGEKKEVYITQKVTQTD